MCSVPYYIETNKLNKSSILCCIYNGKSNAYPLMGTQNAV